MKGCLPLAARVAAIILALLFVLTLPLSLLAFNLGRVAFSPERMTVLLIETVNETGGLRQLVIDSLMTRSGPSEPDGLDLAKALSYLPPQERERLGQTLTPPGWAQAQLGVLVQGVYDWIDNDRARPSFVVDISELKAGLLSGGAADLVETVVGSWPPCTLEQLAQMGVGALLGGQPLQFCDPPEPIRAGLVGLINGSLAVSLRALPDKIALGEGSSSPASPEVIQAKERIQLIRFLASWSWLLSPVMLGLVMALVIRSWRSLALWWGIPLLTGAVLTLASAVAVRVGVEGLARSALAEATMPAWIAGMIHALITALMVVVFRRVTFQALILLAAGAILLVGGLVLTRATGRQTPPVPPDRAETIELPADDAEPPEAGERPSGMFG